MKKLNIVDILDIIVISCLGILTPKVIEMAIKSQDMWYSPAIIVMVVVFTCWIMFAEVKAISYKISLWVITINMAIVFLSSGEFRFQFVFFAVVFIAYDLEYALNKKNKE